MALKITPFLQQVNPQDAEEFIKGGDNILKYNRWRYAQVRYLWYSSDFEEVRWRKLDEKGTYRSLPLKNIVNLHRVAKAKNGQHETCFMVNTEKRKFLFQNYTTENREMWVVGLSHVLNMHNGKTGGNPMQPGYIEDLLSDNEPGDPSRQTSVSRMSPRKATNGDVSATRIGLGSPKTTDISGSRKLRAAFGNYFTSATPRKEASEGPLKRFDGRYTNNSNSDVKVIDLSHEELHITTPKTRAMRRRNIAEVEHSPITSKSAMYGGGNGFHRVRKSTDFSKRNITGSFLEPTNKYGKRSQTTHDKSGKSSFVSDDEDGASYRRGSTEAKRTKMVPDGEVGKFRSILDNVTDILMKRESKYKDNARLWEIRSNYPKETNSAQDNWVIPQHLDMLFSVMDQYTRTLESEITSLESQNETFKQSYEILRGRSESAAETNDNGLQPEMYTTLKPDKIKAMDIQMDGLRIELKSMQEKIDRLGREKTRLHEQLDSEKSAHQSSVVSLKTSLGEAEKEVEFLTETLHKLEST
eukprot:CAMPEP_0114993474 /NCGR_PEP_ID=MMETSP0216-20121206/12551_1 /TAXON_ID=223996 /ORGANISM="Protocruzia adherens, Strain Boccale" /LENGTH=525 /DNA_ID=CAMNT_0002357123 /DNA_START=137 /DNA_END=1710 /DNA_ORIENTATION=+